MLCREGRLGLAPSWPGRCRALAALEAASSLVAAVVEHLADAALLVAALVHDAPREALQGVPDHVGGAQALPEGLLVVILAVLQVLGVLLP